MDRNKKQQSNQQQTLAARSMVDVSQRGAQKTIRVYRLHCEIHLICKHGAAADDDTLI